MNRKLVATQLQRRDPTAWTALLRGLLGTDDVVVTAVSAQPLQTISSQAHRRRVTRYLLALADHSDPITFIGKQVTAVEANFYRHLAPRLPEVAPRCCFIHQPENERLGWLVLGDIPNDVRPARWAVDDVETIIDHLANLHADFELDSSDESVDVIPHFLGHKRYTWEELEVEQAIYFEEGPAAVLSEHAIHNAGRLASTLLEAANGLVIMRDLGGWPGILGETHLTAVADLLDDPVPMLEPLKNLPLTLLHGDPSTTHWHLTLFDDLRLLDWSKAQYGPGVLDLVSFLEQFDLIYEDHRHSHVSIRQERPLSEETMIDSYMLAMSHRLGSQFNGRATRLAIPAARCLYVLANWFPYFATWFAEMPSKYTWQKVNRMQAEQLMGTPFQPMIRFRPYLAAVFQRFLLAYRSL